MSGIGLAMMVVGVVLAAVFVVPLAVRVLGMALAGVGWLVGAGLASAGWVGSRLLVGTAQAGILALGVALGGAAAIALL